MKSYRLFFVTILSLTSLSILLFPYFSNQPLTFSQLKMDKYRTMQKYENDWHNTTIKQTSLSPYKFQEGNFVATITIPKIDIYEFPIYYGANPVNNDWHITTPGHLGNYSLFGEPGVSCVGAHNYQLFKALPTLQVGDKILIETTIDRYVYVVKDSAIYNHEIDDWNRVATAHSDAYALNLMTCYPIDAVKTENMYIVYTSLQKGTTFGT